MLGFLGVFVVASVAGCSAGGAADTTDTSEAPVVTRRCPATLKASFESFDVFTIDEIERAEGFEILDFEKPELQEQIDKLTALRKFEAELVLATAKDAICTYASASPTGATAKFQTRTPKKDILRIDAVEPGAERFSFFVTVTDYKADGIKVGPKATAGIMFREDDSEAAFRPRAIGRARKISLTPRL